MNNLSEELETKDRFFKLSYIESIFYIFIFILGIIPAFLIQGVIQYFFGLEGNLGKIVMITTNIIPFIVVIVMTYFWNKEDKKLSFNFNISWKLLPVISFLMLSVMMLSSYTTTLVPHDSGWLKNVYDAFEAMFKELMNPTWVLIISTCVFAPIFEEILFRGILLKGLINSSKNEKQVWLAIVFTSFMFGVIHMNPWQFIAAMISGIALGYVYYRTKSLGNTIFMHALNNGVSVYILLKYGEMEPAGLSDYPEWYNILFLIGYIVWMFAIYFFTKNNTSHLIK